MPVVYTFGQSTAEIPAIVMVREFTTSVDNGIFGNTLFEKSNPVAEAVGYCGSDEKFLYSVFVLSVEIVGLREAGREKSVAVSPGAVISLVASRLLVGEVSCRAFQTAIKGERPMIIQFIVQIHGRIEEQERTLL